jgi:hypothetical protein
LSESVSGSASPLVGDLRLYEALIVVRSIKAEVVPLTLELVLAKTIKSWAEREFPGDKKAADLAVFIAFRAFCGGASVSEACREARAAVMDKSQRPRYAKAS